MMSRPRNWIRAASLGSVLFLNAAMGADQASDGSIQKDAQLRAMLDELTRSKTLQLNNLDKPYFVEYTIDDPEQVTIEASLGGLLSSTHRHYRQLHVNVRVGSPAFDNTNSIYSGGTGSAPLPTEDSYRAIRNGIWLATDTTYKVSAEQISRKRTALREIADPDQTADFSPAKPVQIVQQTPPLNVDQKAWEGTVQRLSGIFTGHPTVARSTVQMRAIDSTFRLANTEGTVERIPEQLVDIDVRASALASDGSRVWNHRLVVELRPESLPSEVELTKQVEFIAIETEQLAKAPLAEEYNGPVLFEGEAAAQMMAQVLTDSSRLTRKPLTPPELINRVPATLDNVWAARLGSKVTPDWLTIVDDPTVKEFRAITLAGQFDCDEEGVPAQRVTLVEHGTLKGFLLTRQPIRVFNASNGHARLPAQFGNHQGILSSVFVQTTQPKTDMELRKKLLDTVRTAGLKYGMVIRRLDFPSTANVEQLESVGRQLQKVGATRTLTPALLAYRVYLDGHEELVRGVRFKDFSAKDLRDLEAASDHSYVFNFVNNGTTFGWLDAPLGAATSTVICPSLLMSSMELDRAQDEVSKPPIVPVPELAAR